MDFLASQEDNMLVNSATTRSYLSHTEVQQQRSKADKVAWFTHNEFLWRSGASFLWFIFLLPSICMLYLTLVLFSVAHPIAWMIDVLSKILAFWDIFVFIFTFGTIITPVVLLNIKICSVEVETAGVTRLAIIKSFFTVKKMSHLFFCIFCGSLGINCLSSFSYYEYGVFTHNCSSSSYNGEDLLCFSETALFLYVFGGILGVAYSLVYFKEKHYQIKFPVVQQERIFRVKACLVPCFWQAVLISFKSVQVGYLMYYLFGVFAKKVVRVFTGLDRDRQIPRLDSLYGLVDIRLFWFSFTTGLVIVYVWLLTNKLFIVFYTKVLRFPIQSTFTENSHQSLPVVLKCQTVPLLKFLALNDLCQLSQFSPKRRKQIFSLSIPGGRPLNWLWISDECLTLLNDLHERLKVFNIACTLKKNIDSLSSRSLRDINRSSSSIKRTANSVQTTNETTMAGGRSLRHILTGHQSSQHRSSESLEQDKKLLLSEKLKQIPLIEYFTEKVDELEMEDLFSDVQLQIWAADALSRLVAASFTEDVFGVVQKTLPFIMTSLLELLQGVELCLKISFVQENLYRKRQASDVRKTVYVLRDTLRCSIYRITDKFQQHISDIELTARNKEFLISFLKFHE